MGMFDPPSPGNLAAAPPTTPPQPPTMASYSANLGSRRRTANPTVMTGGQGELNAPRRTRTTLLGE